MLKNLKILVSMNSNWVYESSNKDVKQRADKVLSDLKHKRYKEKEIKSVKYEEIPGSIPKAFKEVIEYYD